MIIDLGKAEARHAQAEQSRLEQFAVRRADPRRPAQSGSRRQGAAGHRLRAAPELVSNLFQSEVPEIYDNTVVIRAICPRSRRTHQDCRHEPRQGC